MEREEEAGMYDVEDDDDDEMPEVPNPFVGSTEHFQEFTDSLGKSHLDAWARRKVWGVYDRKDIQLPSLNNLFKAMVEVTSKYEE